MKKLFLDIETASLRGSIEDLLLAGYALDTWKVHALDWFDFNSGPRGAWLDEFRGYLADPDIAVVSHTPFDPKWFREMGWDVAGPLYDTRTMAWVLNENTPLDLDWLTHRYAGLDMDKRLVRHSNRVYFKDDDGTEYELAAWREWMYLPDARYGQVTEPGARFFHYCIRDVEALRDLFNALAERMDESDWTSYWEAEEVPYTTTLLNMELRGLPVNLEATAVLAEDYREQLDLRRAELLADAGLPASFNLNSQKQLVAYLFGRVVHLADSLVYDTDTVEALKSCLDGEHEDCEPAYHTGPGGEDGPITTHVVDFLPEGFVLDKLGRDRVHGHWVVRGRGLKETPPPVNKVTGEKGKLPSTSSPELLYMHAEDEWVRKLCLEYRKLEKLLTTYLDAWPEQARPRVMHWPDGSHGHPNLLGEWELCTEKQCRGETRLYGRFNQTGTVTGRLSSAGPNLQNIPARGARGKAVRSLFEAPPGRVLVVGDYDQLEMRLMAHFSEDRQLLRIFREGHDPHVELAYSLFGRDIDPTATPSGASVTYRDAAKTLNYAMGYGAGPRKVAQTLSLLGWPTTKDQATAYLKEMANFYRGLFRWKKSVIDGAKRRGSVRTLAGRRRRLRSTFKDTANWKLVGYGERQSVNAIVQGSAADIIRRGMVAWDYQHESWELPMLAQVHDEIVLECEERFADPQHLAILQRVFEDGHGFDLSVPLMFVPHAGRTWASAKSGAGLDLDEDLLEMEDDE